MRDDDSVVRPHRDAHPRPAAAVFFADRALLRHDLRLSTHWPGGQPAPWRGFISVAWRGATHRRRMLGFGPLRVCWWVVVSVGAQRFPTPAGHRIRISRTAAAVSDALGHRRGDRRTRILIIGSTSPRSATTANAQGHRPCRSPLHPTCRRWRGPIRGPGRRRLRGLRAHRRHTKRARRNPRHPARRARRRWRAVDFGTVIAGSGTGPLAALRGRATEMQHGVLTLPYTLPDGT